jgi:hypothetical protein
LLKERYLCCNWSDGQLASVPLSAGYMLRASACDDVTPETGYKNYRTVSETSPFGSDYA